MNTGARAETTDKLKVAVFDVMEPDLMQKLLESDQKTTIYTDDGQPVQVFADKMVRALQEYRCETQLGLHYEGNSAQHSPEESSRYHSLKLIYQDTDQN